MRQLILLAGIKMRLPWAAPSLTERRLECVKLCQNPYQFKYRILRRRMSYNHRRMLALTTLPLLVVGIIVGVFGGYLLWEESPELATAVGLSLFIISALGGRLAIEIVLGLTRVFIAVYEIQQNTVENTLSLTEKKVDDIVRLSERDPRFGYSDMQTFPRFARRNPVVQSIRRSVWKACWLLYPTGLVYTLITGSTAAVFEFVGIDYPLIMLAIGGAFTLLTMLMAFGEPLLGNWQIMRKCNRMLQAAYQVEKRLESGGAGNV